MMPTTTRKLEPGDVLADRELRAITGDPVRLPDPDRLTHLQFRRYATCPLCNLHLRLIVQRHDEILADGVREVVVFHSPRRRTPGIPGRAAVRGDRRPGQAPCRGTRPRGHVHHPPAVAQPQPVGESSGQRGPTRVVGLAQSNATASAP
jgi:hypothetical protein